MKKRKFFLKIYGCQMNFADAQKVAQWYEEKNWEETKDLLKADQIIIVSCSVRQSAENRVYGFVNNLKKTNPRAKVILTGCMLRYPKKFLAERIPGVSEFKPIKEFTSSQTRYLLKDKRTIEAYIPIMEGCNNFCSYCVVPYARGREISRPFDELICEIKSLTDCGYRQITLLGQNVNSYGKDFSSEEKERIIERYGSEIAKKNIFAILLNTLHKINKLKKISFLTSNPWDLEDEIIQVLSLPKIDKYLHLPLQSGDDEILRKMNRKYTSKDYLDLVRKIRKKIPEIEIGTDIIVGFPGETEEQFQRTVDLCQKVGFKKAYIAMYSPRPQTAAYRFKDDVPYTEKKRRWLILENLINRTNIKNDV